MKNKAFYLLAFILLVSFVYKSNSSSSSSSTSAQTICKNNTKCSYRISRVDENEYLMVKNILNNLLSKHWNITLEYLFFIPETKELKMCDQYFDHVAVNQVISKDFRHPNNLFKKVNHTNKEVKKQYEIEWFEKYKMIKWNYQSEKYLEKCNNFGLKLHFLLHEYGAEQGKVCGYLFKLQKQIEFFILNMNF